MLSATGNRSVHSMRSHSHTICSGSRVPSAKLRCSSSMRSFTCRKTASFAAFRACRSSVTRAGLTLALRRELLDDLAGEADLLDQHPAVVLLDRADGAGDRVLVPPCVEEPPVVAADAPVVAERQRHELDAAGVGALAHEGDRALAEPFLPGDVRDALVRRPEAVVVLGDAPRGDVLGHANGVPGAARVQTRSVRG